MVGSHETTRNGKMFESDHELNVLREKYDQYRNAISGIGFAAEEFRKLPENPQTLEDLIAAVCDIIDTSKELNQIIEQSPTSIYVADTDGKTLRINQTFETMTEIDRGKLIGANVDEIEKMEMFSPSVCRLSLKEKRRVTIPQIVGGDKEFVVAGVPIIDENGEIFRVITNALLNKDIQKISAYFQKEDEGTYRKPDSNVRIIAVSDKMQDVVKLADAIKETKSTVLIEGETGVGKSLLARYIHNTSRRSSARMTEINCSAIPAALLESELFGYVSGAFTGADRKGKPGLIEMSDGGTILLDEVSELPLSLQVKLLHFLQNKRITRVGGTEEIPVDVRVIAAANRNLEKLVETGEFREDLYYRLNVVPIVIPPLRERPEDIMPAAKNFAEEFGRLYDKHLDFNDKCEAFFMKNPWKGNLRELENYIERLVVTKGNMDIADHIRTGPLLSDDEFKEDRSRTGTTETELHTMGEVERDLIVQAYQKYGSSYKVAEALGISQSTANRKIRKYIGKSK